MSKSVKDALVETVNKFCGDVSHQMSSWLQDEKNLEISPEEICNFFEVSFKPPSTPGLPSGSSLQTQMPTLPNYYAGTGVSPAKKKGGRIKKTVDPNLPTCDYTLTRGKESGKKCKNQVANDGTTGSDKFCKQCLKKAAVKTLIEAPQGKSISQPPMFKDDIVSVSNEPSSKNDELTVVAIKGHEDLFREANYGFIVQQSEDGTIIAKQIDENGVWRDLKESEKKIALKMGIHVINKESEIPKIREIEN